MDFIANRWDIILFFVLTSIHIVSWIGIKEKLEKNPADDPTSRNLGATTLSTASNTGVTAVSILIPASFLILQLSKQSDVLLPEESISNVFLAAVWFFVALFFGLIVVFLVPMRSQKFNVTRDFLIGILFGPQLLALLIGMFRLIISLYHTIYN